MVKLLLLCLGAAIISYGAAVAFKRTRAAKYLERAALAVTGVTVFVLAVNVFIGLFFKGVSFQAPGALWLLFAVIIICAARAVFSRVWEPALTYNIAGKVKPGALTLAVKHASLFLTALALTLAVIALARPRDVNQTVLPPTEGIDIILTLDTSVSMNARDFVPNRMGAARAAAKSFIEKRVADRIGIVAFASEAMLQSPLTLDYDALLDYLDYVNVGIVRAQSTAIGDAVAVSIAHLEHSAAKSKIIILLTDGESNDGAITPLDAAKTAKAYGIKIYTIATVGRGVTPINGGADNFDGAQLREIAAVTGGKYYRAYDNEELMQIYAEIDALEKTKFDNLTAVHYNDRYFGLLLWAAGLLAAAFIIDKTIFVRLP